MELLKDSLTVGEVVYAGCCEIIADGDLIVPDVKADILKVLQVDASACLSGKEIIDGRLTLSGRTNITVLYLPDTDNAQVQSIHTAFDFSHKIERTGIDDTCHAIVDADIIRVDYHVINSRKLSIKAVVGAECEVISAKELEYACSADEAELELEMVNMTSLCAIHEEDFMIKEAIEIPNGKASVNEILKLDLKICDKEFKLITEKIVVKGMLAISVLYTDTSGELEYTDCEIPFTEVFDFPDATEDMSCTLNYRICDLFYELSEDTDGDRRIINIELLSAAEMKAEKTAEVEMIKDCYFPGSKTRLISGDAELVQTVCSPTSQNAVRDVAVVDKNLPQIASVYNVITKAFVTKCYAEEEKLAIEGKIEACILYISDDDSAPVYSFIKEIPFSYMLDSPNASAKADCSASAEVSHVSYHVNVANEVELRCILNIEGRVFERNTLSLICDFETEEIPPEEKKGIVIYFVQPGDTLWKIAKSYSVPVNSIAGFNGIENKDKISVGQRLVIPTVW